MKFYSLLIAFFLLDIVLGMTVFIPVPKVSALVCSGSTPIDCGSVCCAPYTCETCGCSKPLGWCGVPGACSCPCTPTDGNWGTCSTTTFRQTCSTANSCGDQNCTPAGGSQTCCAINTTCNISTNYNTTSSTSTLHGCANGAMNISGGTTTVAAGETLIFGSTLTVSGGILSVANTGTVRANTTCN